MGSISKQSHNNIQFQHFLQAKRSKMGILSSKCRCNARLDGKTAVVTGCNVGIGKETAKDFYQRGAKVIMACRNVEAAKKAAEDIETSSTKQDRKGKLEVVHLDLSSLKSVRECSGILLRKVEKINLLVNNAGVMLCPLSQTEDGFEMHFGTNHLGHFLFTLLLLPKIIQSGPSRIVMVSSCLHFGGKIVFEDLDWKTRPYKSLEAYSQSKLANIFFEKKLARRLGEKYQSSIKNLLLKYSCRPKTHPVYSEYIRDLEVSDNHQQVLRKIILFHLMGSISKQSHNNIQFQHFLQSKRYKMGVLSSKCRCNARLDGKTAVVTGCNVGIGKETAKDFYQRGAKVIMACRNVEAAKKAAEDIETSSKNQDRKGKLEVVHLDLSSLKSVRECSGILLRNEEKINLLVNNAGVMLCPLSQTEDGFEMHFGTNHLGHFLFTLLLLPKIIQSGPSRIVMVSSCLHFGGRIVFEDLNWKIRPYKPLEAYRQSKLANILFGKELARRIGEKNVNIYNLHPGVVATDLSRHFDTYQAGSRNVYDFLARFFAKNAQQGARTTIYCAVHENCAKETGLYYEDCKVKKASRNAEDLDVARRLWDVSWEFVGLKKDYDPFEV